MLNNKIDSTETKMYKVVFPNTLNTHNNLFGGMAMQWMDELAYITATRFTKMRMVTFSTSEIRFLNTIKSGTIVELIGKVLNVGKLKLEIGVEIYVEEMYQDNRYKAVETTFTFIAVDENNNVSRKDLRKY